MIIYCLQTSFDHIEEWLSDVDRYANSGIVCIVYLCRGSSVCFFCLAQTKLLFGNKADLEEKREVSTDKGQVIPNKIALSSACLKY